MSSGSVAQEAEFLISWGQNGAVSTSSGAETKQSSSVSNAVLFSVPLRYRNILLSVTKASICRCSLCCLLLCDTFLTSKHYRLSVRRVIICLSCWKRASLLPIFQHAIFISSLSLRCLHWDVKLYGLRIGHAWVTILIERKEPVEVGVSGV